MAIVTVLQPTLAYDNFLTVSEIQHDHHTVCLLLQAMFTDQPIKKRHEINAAIVLKHKTAYLKLLSLPLSPLPLFSAHIKTTHAKF